MTQDNSKLTVLHVTCYGQGLVGGPYRSVPELVRAQHKLGLRVALLTTARKGGYKEEPFPVFCIDDLPRCRQLARLPEPIDVPDLLNFHSYYEWDHAFLAWEARRRSIPYVITPRGAMTRGAQSRKRLKKLLGNFLFQDCMTAKAAAVHCLTEAEAVDVRKWGCQVFVVPNGTDLSVTPRGPTSGMGNPDVELRLLFLGRLAINHKGLDLLLEGLAMWRTKQPYGRLRLLLVGPDQHGSRAQLGGMVKRLGLTDIVELPGPLVGQAKKEAFLWAHVFVHPSRFEGQPLAVLEALARGLPCLLTPGTNMADQVVAAGAGWGAQPTPVGIASALMEIMSNGAKLPQMGQAARALAERNFNWMDIAEQMIRHYTAIIEHQG
jgi:glycosyltransferase involved in cell wall biosynthesis